MRELNILDAGVKISKKPQTVKSPQSAVIYTTPSAPKRPTLKPPIARNINIPVMRSRTSQTYNYKFNYDDPGDDPAPENQFSYTSPYKLKDEGFRPYDATFV